MGIRKLTEADFLRQVVQLARLYRWRVAHFRPGMDRRGRWATPMQGDTGFPDLVLVKGDRLIFAELKLDTGKTTDEQERWLADVRAAGAVGVIWRPSDWDQIEATLTG